MKKLTKVQRQLVLAYMLGANKTVCMPRAEFAEWMLALRSGKYKQAGTFLCRNKDVEGNVVTPSFCCLGVEQQVNRGEVEVDSLGKDFRILPSMEYIDKHNIVYASLRDGDHWYFNTWDNAPSVQYEGEEFSIASLNDRNVSFERIANLLTEYFVPLEDVCAVLNIEL